MMFSRLKKKGFTTNPDMGMQLFLKQYQHLQQQVSHQANEIKELKEQLKQKDSQLLLKDQEILNLKIHSEEVLENELQIVS